MKFFKRNKNVEDDIVTNEKISEEIIDLSDRTQSSLDQTAQTVEDTVPVDEPHKLSTKEIDDRHAELDRIEKKIDALQMRQHVLMAELRLQEPVVDDAVLFLDATLDAFAASPPAKRPDELSMDFDIDDLEFNERFAAFASSDEKGDHRARRWLDNAK